MQKVLNQEEIDALFARARSQTTGSAAPKRQLVSVCDFRSAGQITKEQLRQLTSLHQTFARNLTHALGAYLRIGLQIAVVSVEQLAYSEFLPRIPDLTYFATFKVNELHVMGGINIDLPLAYPMLDLLLGGRGHPEEKLRDLTEIEQELMINTVFSIVNELSSVWGPMGLSFALGQRQTGDEIAELFAQSERVLAISFEMRLPEVQGMLNLVFPVAVSSLMQRNLQKNSSRRSGSSPKSNYLRDRLMDAEFPMELALPLLPIPARRLLALEPGSVLTLPHKVQEPASLAVSGEQLFSAFPVARDGTRAGYVQRINLPEPQNGAQNESQ